MGIKRLIVAALSFGAAIRPPMAAQAPRSGVSGMPRAVPEACTLRIADTELVCGQLLVPQDRTNPASSAVQKIGYVILKARSARPRPDPLAYLTGGAGISAFYFLDQLAKSPIRETRDIIALELRGNGYSEPNLLCDVEEASRPEAFPRAVQQCWDLVNARHIPVQAYTLAEAAQDVADLRIGLGIAQWNVFGSSHGSFWGARYLALHPPGVRSIILDSPHPSQRDPRDSWVAHLNGLTRIFALCAADAACSAAYPNLRARFIGLIEQLGNGPLTIGETRIEANTAFGMVHGANFESATVPLVPRLIDALLRGDGATIAEIQSISIYRGPEGLEPAKISSTGFYINTACVDDIHNSPAQFRVTLDDKWPPALVEAAKFSSFGIGDEGFCRTVWKVKASDPSMNEPVYSDVPALVTVGALDPETPPEYGKMVASTCRTGHSWSCRLLRMRRSRFNPPVRPGSSRSSLPIRGRGRTLPVLVLSECGSSCRASRSS